MFRAGSGYACGTRAVRPLTLKQVTDATHINGTAEIEVEVNDLETTSEVAVARTDLGMPVAPKVWRELTQSVAKFGITPPGAA